jgi:hypothetical protein
VFMMWLFLKVKGTKHCFIPFKPNLTYLLQLNLAQI